MERAAGSESRPGDYDLKQIDNCIAEIKRLRAEIAVEARRTAESGARTDKILAELARTVRQL